jgi:hypothetical protein
MTQVFFKIVGPFESLTCSNKSNLLIIGSVSNSIFIYFISHVTDFEDYLIYFPIIPKAKSLKINCLFLYQCQYGLNPPQKDSFQ